MPKIISYTDYLTVITTNELEITYS